MDKYTPVDLKALEKRLCSPSRAFLEEGQLMPAHRLLIHKDRGAKVLGVAHLDFVGGSKPAMSYCTTKKGQRIVWNERLDDRLGAYLLLDYLPSLGVEMDVLLTDDEESGKSTGGEFISPKEYNWMVMFDRSGTDLVMYQYETKALRDLVEGFGFKVGIGSFSCIGKMDSLGVAGFNIGTAYYLNHGARGYCLLDEVEEQANKFAAMHAQYKDVKLVHDKSIARRRYHGYQGYGGNSEYYGRFADKDWEQIGPTSWRKKEKKANPYGSIDSGGSSTEDTQWLNRDDLGLTPAEIQEWNREKDFHDMTDAEWAEFCGTDAEMRAADAAYYRMRDGR